MLFGTSWFCAKRLRLRSNKTHLSDMLQHNQYSCTNMTLSLGMDFAIAVAIVDVSLYCLLSCL